MILSDSNNSNGEVEIKKELYSLKMSLARFYNILTFISFGVTTMFLLLTALPIPSEFYNLKITKFFVLEVVGIFPIAMIIGILASFLDWSDKSTRRLFTSTMCFAGALWILVNVAAIYLTKIVM